MTVACVDELQNLNPVCFQCCKGYILQLSDALELPCDLSKHSSVPIQTWIKEITLTRSFFHCRTSATSPTCRSPSQLLEWTLKHPDESRGVIYQKSIKTAKKPILVWSFFFFFQSSGWSLFSWHHFITLYYNLNKSDLQSSNTQLVFFF